MSTSDAASSQPFNGLFLAPDSLQKPPYYEGKSVLIDGKLETWTGEVSTIFSPILKQSQHTTHTTQHNTTHYTHSHTLTVWCVGVVDGERVAIGVAPQMGEAEALRAVHSAAAAYGHGLGYWPTCGVATRIRVIQSYIAALQRVRDEVVNLLMWEICKTREDSEKEVDRTIQYIKDTIVELKKMENSASTYEVVQGVVGHIRRAPLGTVLCLGPFNYPLNETYTTFIPALIMGNTVVMKGTPLTQPHSRSGHQLLPLSSHPIACLCGGCAVGGLSPQQRRCVASACAPLSAFHCVVHSRLRRCLDPDRSRNSPAHRCWVVWVVLVLCACGVR